MNTLQTLLFGLVQGLTEFLPISSSSHLTLLQTFLGIPHKDHGLFLILHVGTACATALFFWSEIKTLGKREFTHLLLSLLPLIPGYLLFKSLFSSPLSISVMGALLVVNGIMLLSVRSGKEATTHPSKATDSLFVGSAQVLALFPGLSRSGFTIFAATKCNWSLEKAVRFSYLLSLPTILGGCIVETRAVVAQGGLDSSETIYGLAFLSSFLVGSMMIRSVYPILCRGRFLPFAIYCLLLGSGILLYEKILR